MANSRSLRWMLAGLVAAGLCAQDQPNAAKPEDQTPTFTSRVERVVAAVVVTDRNGDYVDGLQPNQFHLFDNDKEQDIQVDVAFPPISLVIAVQANDRAEPVLPAIRRVGSMVQSVLIGEQGEASVIAFDSRIRTMQEFTRDSDRITEALKKIQPGSSQSRMIDAVEEGVNQLRNRPRDHRRVMLLISETRDKSSEARVRETLLQAQVYNVSIYTVDISRLVATVMAPADPGRPNNNPPAATPLPSNAVATPNTVMQATGSTGSSAQFVPLMVEIFKDVKSIFIQNPAEVFARGTGGQQFGFARQRWLEEAFEHIGAELHSQYLISYNPNNKDEGGFHQISVLVAGRNDVKTRTRPGYWLGAK